MVSIIEEAAVRVLPDLTDFRTALIADLNTATVNVTASVKAEIDTSAAAIISLRRSLTNALNLATTGSYSAKIKVIAEIDRRSLRDELKALGGQIVHVKVIHDDVNKPTGLSTRSSGGSSSGGGSSPFTRSAQERLDKAHMDALAEDAQRASASQAAQKAVTPFTSAISSAFSNIPGIGSGIAKAIEAGGPEVAAAAVAVGAAAGAVLVTAAGAAITAAAATGVLTVGIVLALKDPAIAAGAKAQADDISKVFTEAAKVLGPAITSSLQIVSTEVQKLQPVLTQMFTSLSPALTSLAQGLSSALDKAAPGLEKITAVGSSLLQTIASHIPDLGSAVSKFGDAIASAGPGFNAFLSDLLTELPKVVEGLGNLIALASNLYDAFSKLGLIKLANLQLDVLNGIVKTANSPFDEHGVLGTLVRLSNNPNLMAAFEFMARGQAAKDNPNTYLPVAPIATQLAQNIIGQKTTLEYAYSSVHPRADGYQADSPEAAIADKATESYKTYTAALKDASTAKQAYNDLVQSDADAEDAASKRITAAQQRVKDIQDQLKQSVIDLSDARETARRKLRDSADTEEAAKIRLEQAKQQVAATEGLGPENLQRRQALLDLKNAEEVLGDTQKDNATLQKKGIEGSDEVQSVLKTQAGLNRDLATAQDEVKTASHDRAVLLDKDKRAEDEARQRMVDAKTAAEDLYAALSPLDRSFIAKMTVDKGDSVKQLQDIQAYVYALGLQAANPSLSPADAWKSAQNLANFNGGADTKSSQSIVPTKSYNVPIPRAYGGGVYGPGTDTSDNIHAWLSPGEHVWTAKEVRAAGGHQAVEMMRKQVLGEAYATGGPVTWNGPHVAVDKMNLADRILQSLHPSTDIVLPTSYAELMKQVAAGNAPVIPLGSGKFVGDIKVARIAEATARSLGATVKQMVALMEAGIVESGMRNLNYGDRDSVGFLQQRPSQGWPNPRDVATATRSFIKKAMRVDKSSYSSGQLAQAVQVSAFPGRYALQEANAYAILNREAPYVLLPAGATTPAAPASGGASFTPGYKNQLAALRAAGFNFHPSIGQTTGGVHAANSWHYPSKHPPGRAVDLSPPNDAVWNWLVKNYANTSQELYWASKAVNYAHGKQVGPRDKRNHIHWAYRDGGAVLADNGAVLAPRSVTQVINGTNKPEHVGFPGEISDSTMRRLAVFIAQALATRPGTVRLGEKEVGEVIRDTIGDKLRLQ